MIAQGQEEDYKHKIHEMQEKLAEFAETVVRINKEHESKMQEIQNKLDESVNTESRLREAFEIEISRLQNEISSLKEQKYQEEVSIGDTNHLLLDAQYGNRG